MATEMAIKAKWYHMVTLKMRVNRISNIRVASVTRKFCDSCDRVRLTADGQFRNCLFAVEEFDLRSLLRSGASDEDLSELLQGAVAAKWAGHGISSVDFIRPNRSMSQIGG